MHWLIENLDLLFGVGEILSGVKRIVLASAAAVSLQACSYQVRHSQDAIGVSTDTYAMSWGNVINEAPPPQPVRYVAPRPAPRRAVARRDYYAPVSPLAPKEYQGS